MKKLICLILALCMICALFAGCTQGGGESNPTTTAPTGTTGSSQPTEKYEHLSANGITTWDTGYMREDLTALELVHLMGNGTNLGNTMEACDTGVGSSYMDDPAYYEVLWGQPITTQEMITGMKAAGFDTLRIPIAWMTNATELATTGDYTIAPEYLDRVEEIINYALNADMYVIINDHWDGGWYGMFGSESAETRALAMEAYKGMWTQIANRYKEYSDYLIFEGANEEIGARFDENSSLYCSDSITTYLSDDEKYALANEVNQAFVDAVRATGGNNANRFLLIPGFGTNIANTCDDRFVMPTDSAEDKLLISVHYYDPWAYCGDGQSTVKWGTKSDIQYMMDTLAKMTKFTEQGVGVVIGEYGVLYATEVQDNTDLYHQLFLDLCDLYNYTSCLWDCSAFFNRSQLTMVEELKSLYAKRNVASYELMTMEEEGIMANRRLNSSLEAAPESFREGIVEITDTTTMAWIMWNSGDYACTYSVGDTYNPDSMTEGLVDTVTVLEGEGTYTVGLDFTGTAVGYSAGVAFGALAITNGEVVHPGWIIDIREIRINGEVYTPCADGYTTSDNAITTRVNLFNEWVTKVPDGARTLDGDLSNASASILDRNDSAVSHIETLEITFYYGPAA